MVLAPMPAGIHRFLNDPARRADVFTANLLHPLRLMVSARYRLEWFQAIVSRQAARGLVTPIQAQAVAAQISGPRMQSFLRDFGITLGLELISKPVYLILAAYGFSERNFIPLAVAALGPISPSGVVRWVYTLVQLVFSLPEIVQKRDTRLLLARLSGCLFSPWRWIGNLFAPLEMFSYYNTVSLLLADYWVSELVARIPIFGGRGSLLEYGLFNLVYNLPISLRSRITRK
jgi:hypothetical protein